MATFIKGNPVTNATSYELLEKNSDGTYRSLKSDVEIDFEVSALGLAEGSHTLVVKAHADGYESSDPSNEVVYTVGGEPEITYHTITYNYVTSDGTTVKDATTETVVAGTQKTFSTSDAPVIDGHTISSVNPTSVTVNGDITVTYTYTVNQETGNTVFDFDFATNTIDDYALSDIFTVPDTSVTSSIEYDGTYGMSLNGQLPYGLSLINPIDASKPWTLEFTALIATPSDLVGNRKAILTGGDDLAPFVVINGQTLDKLGFQISSGAHTWVGTGNLIYDQEVSYKMVHDGANTTTVYQNGIELGKSSADWTGKQFGTILGVIKGKSSAYTWKNVETNKSYLHKFKFYYN